MRLFSFLLLAFITVLTSCSAFDDNLYEEPIPEICYGYVTGIVTDQETGMPVEGIPVGGTETNQAGRYIAQFTLWDCAPKGYQYSITAQDNKQFGEASFLDSLLIIDGTIVVDFSVQPYGRLEVNLYDTVETASYLAYEISGDFYNEFDAVRGGNRAAWSDRTITRSVMPGTMVRVLWYTIDSGGATLPSPDPIPSNYQVHGDSTFLVPAGQKISVDAYF